MKRWWDALASRQAVSIWSWVSSLLIALVNAPQLSGQYEVDLGVWLIAALLFHLGLAPVLLVGGALHRRIHGYHRRIAFVIGAFIVFGALRAFVMAIFVEQASGQDFLPIFLSWLPASTTIPPFTMAGAALLYHGFRVHSETMSKLKQMEEALAQFQEENLKSENELREQLLDQVRQQVKSEVSQLEAAPTEANQSLSDRLRTIANSVIRPLSHSMIFSTYEEKSDFLPSNENEEKVYGVREILQQVKPVNYILAPVFVEIIVRPFVLLRYGTVVSLLNFTLTTPSLIFFSYLIERRWRQVGAPTTNSILLTLNYWVTGALSAIPVYLAANSFGFSMPFYLINGFFYLFIVTLFVLDSALESRRHIVQNRVTRALQLQSIEISRYRDKLHSLRQGIGKVLHSQVQGGLIAMALKRDWHSGQRDDGKSVDANALIDGIFKDLGNAEDLNRGSKAEIADLLDIWSGVLLIELVATEEVWQQLDRKSAVKSKLIDVIAEGLTNAVKHGNRPEVLVQISVREESCEVTIRSRGSLDRNALKGAGTQIVSNSTESLNLREHEGVIELVAQIA